MRDDEWWDVSWNPVSGCDAVSEGCAHCFAKRMANRLRGRYGYPADEPFRVTLHPERLDEPMHWRKPRRVFVCSMGDFWHPAVPLKFQCQMLTVMKACPEHTFMILSKRAEQMAMFNNACGWGSLPNVWLGVSAENQERADERIPLLLETPAAVHFISAEPLLGPINLSWAAPCPDCGGAGDMGRADSGKLEPCQLCGGYGDALGHGIDKRLALVIVGGETGPGARPMNPDWARALRDQCEEAGVAFFMKKMSGGAEPPPDLMVRQWPGEG